MKKAEEWFQDLPFDLRKDAMYNTRPTAKTRIQPSLHQAITASFNWEQSHMGHKFWEALRNDIRNGKVVFGTERYQIY